MTTLPRRVFHRRLPLAVLVGITACGLGLGAAALGLGSHPFGAAHPVPSEASILHVQQYAATLRQLQQDTMQLQNQAQMIHQLAQIRELLQRPSATQAEAPMSEPAAADLTVVPPPSNLGAPSK